MKVVYRYINGMQGTPEYIIETPSHKCINDMNYGTTHRKPNT